MMRPANTAFAGSFVSLIRYNGKHCPMR